MQTELMSIILQLYHQSRGSSHTILSSEWKRYIKTLEFVSAKNGTITLYHKNAEYINRKYRDLIQATTHYKVEITDRKEKQ
jgi:hypothetical protein